MIILDKSIPLSWTFDWKVVCTTRLVEQIYEIISIDVGLVKEHAFYVLILISYNLEQSVCGNFETNVPSFQ